MDQKVSQNRGNDSSDEDLRAQLETLKADFAELSKTVKTTAKGGLSEVEEKAIEKVENLESQIRKNPVQSALIAAGTGFLLGAILSR